MNNFESGLKCTMLVRSLRNTPRMNNSRDKMIHLPFVGSYSDDCNQLHHMLFRWKKYQYGDLKC